MVSTGNAVLDDICTEYKRLGNIDVLNNAWACFFELREWDRMGRPNEVVNSTYAVAPWVATLKRMAKDSDKMTDA